MTDLFGPAANGAANAASARPAFIPENSVGTPDSWVRDCTSPSAADGTEDRAAAMNAILANLRRGVRGNAVPESNLDDSLLERAIRGGRGQWVTFGGTTNNWTVARSLPAAAPFVAGELGAGTIIRGLAPFAPTGAMTLVNDGGVALGAQWADGTAIAALDIVAGQMVELAFDGALWRFIHGLSPSQIRAQSRYFPPLVQKGAGTGSYTPGSGVFRVRIRGVAPGGGGGASNNSTAGGALVGNAGSGGGAGAAFEAVLSVTPGVPIPFSIGAKGLGVTAASGTPGGVLTIGSAGIGAIITATGGTSGAFGSNTKAPGGLGGVPTAIGVNVLSFIDIPGGNGGMSGTNTAATSTSDDLVQFVSGGDPGFGYSTPVKGLSGQSATGYGGGGSAASGGSGLKGGDGADGMFTIEVI